MRNRFGFTPIGSRLRGDGEWSQGFTLIELLVVIAILAVLAVVVVLTLNPAGLLQESRDSNRLSDMATLNSAISLSLADNSSESLGLASTTYVSVPDQAATSTAGNQCQGLGLPSLPAGWAWHCAASSTFRKADGTGWVPVNLGANAFGSSLAQLPTDPINATSTGLYYTYVTNGQQYEVTSLFESQKNKSQFGQSPQVPGYPEVNAKGSSVTLNPLFNASGLVGYWPMDEGTGSTAVDASGNGNGGNWQSGSSYAVGKVGSYAGNFTGSNSIDAGNNLSLNITSAITITAWVNQTAWTTYPSIVSKGYATTGGYDVHVRNDNSIWFEMDESNGTRHYYDPTSLSITNGVWTFIAATYDGSVQRVYINGQQNGSGLSGIFTAGIISTHVGIGAGGSGSAFNGSIDDARIYNRALTAAEIAAIYNAGK